MSIHSQSVVIDGLIISKWDKSILEDMRRGGLTAANCTVSIWEGFAGTVDNIVNMKQLIRENADLALQVRGVADIRRAKAEGKTGIILGFQNSYACEDNLGHVEAFADMGVRIMQLCYNTQNLVGTGCYERDSGLSGYGHELVAEMNRLGILIDITHGTEAVHKQLIEASKTPVVASRSTAWRPIGASTWPPPVISPTVSARYSRCTSRAASSRTRAVCVTRSRATTKSPLVSLSSRWMMPARGTSPRRES